MKRKESSSILILLLIMINITSIHIDINQVIAADLYNCEYINNRIVEKNRNNQKKIYCEDVNLKKGQSMQLKVKLQNKKGKSLTENQAMFSYISEKPEIAEVFADGTIVGKKIGKCKLSVKYEDKNGNKITKKIKVKVKKQYKSLHVELVKVKIDETSLSVDSFIKINPKKSDVVFEIKYPYCLYKYELGKWKRVKFVDTYGMDMTSRTYLIKAGTVTKIPLSFRIREHSVKDGLPASGDYKLVYLSNNLLKKNNHVFFHIVRSSQFSDEI